MKTLHKIHPAILITTFFLVAMAIIFFIIGIMEGPCIENGNCYSPDFPNVYDSSGLKRKTNPGQA